MSSKVDKGSLLLFGLNVGKTVVGGTVGPAVGCIDGKNAGRCFWIPVPFSVGKGVIGCLFRSACVGASVAAGVVLVLRSSLVGPIKIEGTVERFIDGADKKVKEGALVTCSVGTPVVVEVALVPLDCSSLVEGAVEGSIGGGNAAEGILAC